MSVAKQTVTASDQIPVDQDKKESRRDYTSLRAWQCGHEINLAVMPLLKGMEDDGEVESLSMPLLTELRQSVVAVMKAYRAFERTEKIACLEQAIDRVSSAYYYLFLGQELGYWSCVDFLDKVDEYSFVLRCTVKHFLDKKTKSV